MSEVHFMEHFRYNRFIRMIEKSGTFPECPRHQFCLTNVLDFLDDAWKKNSVFKDIVDIWEAVSLFVTFHLQQPVPMRLEMLTPYDFSRFINFYVPIFKPEIKDDYPESRRVLAWVAEFFRFLKKAGSLDSTESIDAALRMVFKDGKINRIRRNKLSGPEWAVIRESKTDGERIVFTFSDIWLLAALELKFRGDVDSMFAFLNAPGQKIVDSIKKQAHLARLLKKLRRHRFDFSDILNGVKGRSLKANSTEWIRKGAYVSSLADLD